jgi:WD40 repeat protein
MAASLSHDGKLAVIGDWDGSAGIDYGVYLQKMDGSPATLLGTGVADDISPDGKWVTSILPSDTSKVQILPTSVGEMKTVTAPNFHYRSAKWATDGTRLIVRGSEADRPVRIWVQNINGDKPRAVTPEGVDGRFVTLKQSDYVAARDSAGTLQLYSLEGGQPKAVPGASHADQVLGGSAEGDFLYVTSDPYAVPLIIAKLNVLSGIRQPFLSISPIEPAGIVTLFPPIFALDEKAYLYTQMRDFSVLYAEKGMR